MILHSNEKEKINSPEKAKARAAADERSESGLTLAQVERTVKERAAMLQSVERFLRVSTRTELREKLEREQKLLLALVEREKEMRAHAKKMIHILNKAYFIQKPLDISIFE